MLSPLFISRFLAKLLRMSLGIKLLARVLEIAMGRKEKKKVVCVRNALFFEIFFVYIFYHLM